MLRREFLDNGTLTHRANPCQSQTAHCIGETFACRRRQALIIIGGVDKKPPAPIQ